MNTSGALILSNDGDFVYHITHPKHEIEKTYIATVEGEIEDSKLTQLRNGVKIDDYITRPAKVRILNYDNKKNRTNIEIMIHEGKNRQVRKMLEAIGKETIALQRYKIGELNIDGIEIGKWRYLKQEEVDKLTRT